MGRRERRGGRGEGRGEEGGGRWEWERGRRKGEKSDKLTLCSITSFVIRAKVLNLE